MCIGQTSLAQDLRLPDFGDPSLQYLSLDKERQLGAQVQQRLRERGLIIDDPQLNEYLSSVGQRIATYADQTSHDYNFYWINAESINAFAAPGGFIGMHAGLLLATRNEDEFAGVLAHEIAHVSQRHIARAFADAQRLSIPMAAAMLASIAIAAAGGEGGAALTGALALGAQRQLNLTRANELEADRVGQQLLTKAGFSSNALIDFFTVLQRQSSSTRVPEFLLTHPLPLNRIADAQNRVAVNGNVQNKNAGQRDALAYHLAKARIRVLIATNSNELVQYFNTLLKSGDYQNKTATRYGYALALQRAGRYQAAQKQVAVLRKALPNRLAFRILEAELALASGQQRKAWALFEQSSDLYPDNFSLAISYARGLAIEGEPHKAMRLLQPYLQRRPRAIPLYELYAQAAQRAGDRAATHAAMAEYHYLNGDLPAAIQQARLGLKQSASTTYQQARLQARLKQFEQENRVQ